ncbi:MAG TPA: protein-glutamate O-methyltransferase CheR [Caulobacteraceae bacterium]|nr:protein-glutamate O-methyltransferase CheR [Caulobacteraceae bacterium]
MTPANEEILRRIVHGRAGVVIDRAKSYAIESALAPLVRRENFGSIDELMNAIRERRDERLMWAVTEAMSPGETQFFRDSAPFAVVRDVMLPRLAERAGDQPIKIWSSACATGQEIYSLAMLADEDRPKLGGARIELFASDLSEGALAKAQSGLYTQFEVQRGLPIKLLLRYFERDGEMWRISPSLRQMIRWRRINLLADLSALGRFDIIFCRYVTGFFDEATRARVLDRLTAGLCEGGYLVLGADEHADGRDGLTRLVGQPGVYVREAGARAAA